MTVAAEPARGEGSAVGRASPDESAPLLNLTTLAALLPGPLSLGAAAIHYAVMSEHFAEYWAFGVFFASSAWFQAWWAVEYSLPNRTQLLWWVGVLVNALVVAIWIVSRSTGLPFGPRPGETEPIGAPDVMATVLEVALVIVLLALGPNGAARAVSGNAGRGNSRLVSTLLVTLVALATTLALIVPRPE
jgi:hypothetical protein